MGPSKADLRIIAESSFLQPNVLTLLVKGASPITQVSQLKGKVVSVNARNDIGTLLIDSLLVAHGLKPGQAFTTALSQGQQIADTDRAAVEQVLQKYLHIDKQAVAFISLPAFPLGGDAARLQRVVSSMKRFGLLPRGTSFQVTSMIAG